MSWALQFDGVNDYTTALAWNPSALGFSFGIEFIAGTLTHNIMDGTYSKGVYIRYNPVSGELFVWYNNQTLYTSTAPNQTFVSGNTYKIEGFVYADGSGAIFVDDIPVDNIAAGTHSIGASSTALTFSKTTFSPDSYSNFQLLSAWCTDNTTPSNSRHYNPTASSHTVGTPILTDTVGGNNATGVNMPTDGSAWVDLGGGGGITLTADIEINKPIFAVQSSVTFPQPSSVVLFEIDKPVFSASITITSPVFSSAINFTVDKPTFSASISVTDQTTQSNVNFNIVKPVFSVESSVTLPLPVSSVQFTIDKPIFNVLIVASQPIPPIPQKTGEISFGVLGDGINSFGFAGNGNTSSGKL